MYMPHQFQQALSQGTMSAAARREADEQLGELAAAVARRSLRARREGLLRRRRPRGSRAPQWFLPMGPIVKFRNSDANAAAEPAARRSR